MSENNLIGMMLFQGSVKSSDFGAFLLFLLKNNNVIKSNLNNYIFYMDNASIHKANLLNKLKLCVRIKFIPPYSPMINPIEEVFAIWKHNIRKEEK